MITNVSFFYNTVYLVGVSLALTRNAEHLVTPKTFDLRHDNILALMDHPYLGFPLVLRSWQPDK